MTLAFQKIYTRKTFGVLCGFAAALFSVVFVISLFRDEFGFLSRLAIWFLAFLSYFHANYALKENLTIDEVRRIDYFYLGAAALGLFILAGNYSEQRAQIYAEMFADVDDKRIALDSRTSIYAIVACDRRAVPDDNHCKKAEEVRAALKTDPDPPILVKMNSEFFQWLHSPESNEPRTVERDAVIDLGLKVWESLGPYARAKATAASLKNVKPAEQRPKYDWIGQAVIWPFVLAIAFALRITKVTVEANRWAESSVTPSTS